VPAGHLRAPALRLGAGVAVVLMLVPALLATPTVEATTPRVMTWDYAVKVEDPKSGLARVTMTFGNLEGIVTEITLRTVATEARPYAITNVTAGPGTDLTPTADGARIKVRSALESFSFDVAVSRASHKAGQWNSILNEQFGLFRADAFALPFTYSYYQGKPFVWDMKVRIEPPAGWEVETPWPSAGVKRWDPPGNSTLPRGFVAMGPAESFHREATAAASTEFRYVRLGKALAHDGEVLPFLAAATPYYRSVYGDVAGPVILAVSAPSPMYEGGLGGPASLYVHESTDLRTLAHEYAHVFQAFATVDDPGRSSLWINEGDADFHSILALFATERWNRAEVDDWMRKASQFREKSEGKGRLVDAAYGPAENIAYLKGAVLLAVLDDLLREDTAGAVTLATVLTTLNREFDASFSAAPGGPRQVGNEELKQVLLNLTRRDYSAFFERYVFGTEWPPFARLELPEEVSLDDLVLDPARASSGERVTATLTVTNRGVKPLAKSYDLTVDGAKLAVFEVDVPVGETRTATATFSVAETGDHTVRVAYLERDLRVLTPPSIRIQRVTTLPFEPAALATAQVFVYVENTGDRDGDLRLIVKRDDELLESVVRTLPGRAVEAVAVTTQFPIEGPHVISAAVSGPHAESADPVTLAVVVGEADRDDDGVPDSLDAFPTDPKLSEPGVVNDLRHALPGPGPAFLVAALAAVAIAFRRRA